MSKPAQTPTSKAESIAWGAVLFAVFVTPLAMSDFGWLGIERPLTASIYLEPKMFVLRASVLVALAAWAWAVFVDGKPLRRTTLDRWVLAFVAWLGVTTVVSIQPLTSVFGQHTRGGGLVTYVLYGLLFFLVAQLADKGARMVQMAKTLFWSGVIVSSYGVLQYLGIDWVDNVPAHLGGRAYSTLGNPMILGGYLVFVVPVSAALALLERHLVWRAVYWAGALLGLLALLVTFTRSAWIGGAVACVLIAAYAVRQRVKLERTVDLSVASLAVVALALVAFRSILAVDRVTNVFARLGELVQFDSGSGFSRLGLWQAAYAATLERPVAGFGLDTFRLFSTGYLTPEYARAGDYLAIPDNAHGYLFQLASTTGVVGLALFVALVVIVAWVSVRMMLAVPRGSARSAHIILAAFWAASAGYLVNLFAGISMPGTTFLLWISMGLLLAPSASASQMKPIAGARMWAVSIAVVCAAVLFMSAIPLRADAWYRDARTLRDPQSRIAAAEAAVRLAPFYDAYRTTLAVAHADSVTGSLSMADTLDASGREQLQAAYDAALGELEAAREFSPWEQNNYNVLVVMYNLGGRHLDTAYYDGAIRTAEDGLERFLHAPNLRLHYAIALEATGKVSDAQRELEQLVEIEPRMAEGAVQLARIYQSDGEDERAADLLRTAQARAIDSALVARALDSLDRGEPIPSVGW